jgi:hypothetical protein
MDSFVELATQLWDCCQGACSLLPGVTARKRVQAVKPVPSRMIPCFNAMRSQFYFVPFGINRGALRLFVMARKIAVSLVMA